MKCNVGSTDRIVRIILGLVVIGIGYMYQSWWGAIGLVFLATGLFSFCPLYIPFKLNTKADKE